MPALPGPQEADFLRLRADWEQFRQQVEDPLTGLPTLAAVLDDVRRLAEERGSLGLVYFDLGGDGAFEAQHGSAAHDTRVQAFAAALGRLKQDARLGARDIIAVIGVRGDKFLVFLRAAEAADPVSLEARAARLQDLLLAAQAELLPQDLPAAPAFHQGHAVLYRDPMLRAERSIHRALDEAMFVSLRHRTREDRPGETLDDVIGGGVVTLYQPIVELASGSVRGHEVFNRGPAGGPFEDADRLFALAERTGRLLHLERTCRARALSSARRHLRPGVQLFLNTSARALVDREVGGPGFVRQVDELGLAHGDVVVEVSERVAVEEREAYRDVLAALKRSGFRIAIDDLGHARSSLQSLVEVEPDYLKFDLSQLPLARDVIRRSVLETLVELARKIGAQVIVGGIESEEDVSALLQMGVGLGQGRHLAPPAPVPAEIPETA